MVDPVTERNAKLVEKKYRIPASLYIEICDRFALSKTFAYLDSSNSPLKAKVSSAFAYGLIIGLLKFAGVEVKGKEALVDEILSPES